MKRITHQERKELSEAILKHSPQLQKLLSGSLKPIAYEEIHKYWDDNSIFVQFEGLLGKSLELEVCAIQGEVVTVVNNFGGTRKLKIDEINGWFRLESSGSEKRTA